MRAHDLLLLIGIALALGAIPIAISAFGQADEAIQGWNQYCQRPTSRFPCSAAWTTQSSARVVAATFAALSGLGVGMSIGGALGVAFPEGTTRPRWNTAVTVARVTSLAAGFIPMVMGWLDAAASPCNGYYIRYGSGFRICTGSVDSLEPGLLIGIAVAAALVALAATIPKSSVEPDPSTLQVPQRGPHEYRTRGGWRVTVRRNRKGIAK